jgi:hypothetical protein
MPTGQYAQNTAVDSSTSRAEIERTLVRYGASSFAYGWQDQAAMIGFVANGRQVRFVLPMPDRRSRDFTMTPTGRERAPKAQQEAYEQAVRQRWRALALVVKAKLEAVASGIVTFDEEFYAHMVLPGGQTVYQATSAAVEQAHATGDLRPLLQIGAR